MYVYDISKYEIDKCKNERKGRMIFLNLDADCSLIIWASFVSVSVFDVLSSQFQGKSIHYRKYENMI